MNRIFRVLWSTHLQRYVVASELSKGRGKTKSLTAGNAPSGAPQALTALSAAAVAVSIALAPMSVLAADTIIADGVSIVSDGEDITATGDRSSVGRKSMGLSAGNGGEISFSNGSLKTTGTGGLGAIANNASSITLRNTAIETSGASAVGLVAQNTSTLIGESLTIKTHGANAAGAQSLNSRIELNDVSISTSGQGAHGLNVDQGGTLIFNNGFISATGNSAYAAAAMNKNAVININNSTLSTDGSSAQAVYARDGGTVNLKNTNITTSRVNGYGLRSFGIDSMITFDGGTITTAGDARSVQATYGRKLLLRNATISSQNKGVDISGGSEGTLDNVLIHSKGTGILLSNNAVLTGRNIKIDSEINNSPAIQIQASSADINGLEITQSGPGAARSLEVFSGSILIAKNVLINIDNTDEGVSSYGIGMGSGKGDNTAALSDTQVSLSGKNSIGIAMGSSGVSHNILSLTNSAIRADSGTVLSVSSGSTGALSGVINTYGTLLSGDVLLSAGVKNTGTRSDVELTGDKGSVFRGDIVINRANVDTNIVNLNNSSSWSGGTQSLENLHLTGGSQWSVTKDSAVDNLSLDHSTLNIAAGGADFTKVTLGSLNSDNGRVLFNTRLGGDDSPTSHLNISGDYKGHSSVEVTNAGGSGEKTLNGIELIRVDGNNSGTFTQQGRIVAGAYDYKLVQSGNRWLLKSEVNPIPDPDTDDGDVSEDGTGSDGSSGMPGNHPPVQGTSVMRPEAGSYAANLAAGNTLFSTSLTDRPAGTVFTDAAGHKHSTSLWLRQVAGHTRFSDSSGQLKSSGNRYVMQLGGDIGHWSTDNTGGLHLGVMAGYAHSQSNTRSAVTGYSAKGQASGYSGGVYATWFQNEAEKTGAYIDGWALYNRFSNSVKGEGIGQESYTSRGLTASAESGYTLRMAEITEQSDLYIQPKVQLNWMGVKADGVKEDNGTRVASPGHNNVQSRAGVRAFVKDRDANRDDHPHSVMPFAEVSWLHNTRSFGSTLNGVTVRQAGSRNLAEVKVGLDAKLGSTVSLWGDVGQQLGIRAYSDTSATMGVKIKF